jgi:uncharacterized protein (TIGR00369 family)
MLDPQIEAHIRERLGVSEFVKWFGIELVSLGNGEGTLRISLEPHHLNPGGIVHGGVVATLLDGVIGIALRTRLPLDRTHVTLQLQVTYLRSVGAGSIIARGTAVRSGTRVGYGEADLTDESGTLLARATATYVVRSAVPDEP